MQAVRHMKHLRDEGGEPDQSQHSQITLSARQQLALDSQIASPQLPTPSQKPVGLRTAGPPTPGLGYTPTSQPDTPPAAAPAPAPAPTPEVSTPQLPPTAHGRSRPQTQKASLQPHDGHLQQQQNVQQAAEAATLNSNPLEATMHWQGGLYVVSPKGEEFVCELATEAWPSHLPRYVCQQAVPMLYHVLP